MRWMTAASAWLGLAPRCRTLAIALVESECTTICLNWHVWNHPTTAYFGIKCCLFRPQGLHPLSNRGTLAAGVSGDQLSKSSEFAK